MKNKVINARISVGRTQFIRGNALTLLPHNLQMDALIAELGILLDRARKGDGIIQFRFRGIDLHIPVRSDDTPESIRDYALAVNELIHDVRESNLANSGHPLPEARLMDSTEPFLRVGLWANTLPVVLTRNADALLMHRLYTDLFGTVARATVVDLLGEDTNNWPPVFVDAQAERLSFLVSARDWLQTQIHAGETQHRALEDLRVASIGLNSNSMFWMELRNAIPQ